MESFLNILLIAILLVIGVCILQIWKIIKKGKNRETVDKTDVVKLERRLNVIHIGVYILVVILVFHLYLTFIAR